MRTESLEAALKARSGLERVFSYACPYVPSFSLGFSENTDKKVCAGSLF